jgi:hypothetical protein
MNAELAKRTPFADPTFRDIADRISRLLAPERRISTGSMLPKSLTC